MLRTAEEMADQIDAELAAWKRGESSSSSSSPYTAALILPATELGPTATTSIRPLPDVTSVPEKMNGRCTTSFACGSGSPEEGNEGSK